MSPRLFLLLATAAVVAFPGPAVAAPVRPTDPNQVVATVAATRDRGDLKRLRAAVIAEPENLARALAFAQAAIADARDRSDPRRYGEVEAVLRPWWNDADPPTPVRLVRAVVRQALHDFAAAEADLDVLLERSPLHGQARLTRAFLRMTTGRVEAAMQDCGRLPPTLGRLPAAACRARAEALAGRPAAGLELLDRVRAEAVAAPAALTRWATTLGAELAEMAGDDEAAERRYRSVAEPDAIHAAAHADLLIRKGRPAEALALIYALGDPDALATQRALAAWHGGDVGSDGLAARLLARLDAAEAAGIRLHERDAARLLLATGGDPARALVLAERNFALQKEPSDARLLVEAALAAGRPAAAGPVVDFVAATGLADARLAPLLARVQEPRS